VKIYNFNLTLPEDAPAEYRKAWTRKIENFAYQNGFSCKVHHGRAEGKNALICDLSDYLHVLELKLAMGGDKCSLVARIN